MCKGVFSEVGVFNNNIILMHETGSDYVCRPAHLFNNSLRIWRYGLVLV